jgi:hypothetical protein
MSEGFPLSSMKQFLDTRSPNDPRLTLLDFLVLMLVENGEASILWFDEEMPTLFAGSCQRSSLEMCEAQLQLLSHGVERVKTELKEIITDEHIALHKNHGQQLQLWAAKHQQLEECVANTSSALMGREDTRQQPRRDTIMDSEEPTLFRASPSSAVAEVKASTAKGRGEARHPHPRANLLSQIQANGHNSEQSSATPPRLALLAGICSKQNSTPEASSVPVNPRASLLDGIRSKPHHPSNASGGRKHPWMQIQGVSTYFKDWPATLCGEDSMCTRPDFKTLFFLSLVILSLRNTFMLLGVCLYCVYLFFF